MVSRSVNRWIYGSLQYRTLNLRPWGGFELFWCWLMMLMHAFYARWNPMKANRQPLETPSRTTVWLYCTILSRTFQCLPTTIQSCSHLKWPVRSCFWCGMLIHFQMLNSFIFRFYLYCYISVLHHTGICAGLHINIQHYIYSNWKQYWNSTILRPALYRSGLRCREPYHLPGFPCGMLGSLPFPCLDLEVETKGKGLEVGGIIKEPGLYFIWF